MFGRWNQSSRAVAGRALLGLMGASGCLAAVAYAASGPFPLHVGGERSAPHRGGTRPPRPRITGHHDKTTLSTSVAFHYVDALASVGFQCKLDREGWKRCAARIAYRGLDVGSHRFLVRATGGGRGLSFPTRFNWSQMEPEGFSIAELSGLGRLFPGAAPLALPLVLSNPNSSPIFVTSLTVSVTGDPAGCASGENLELVQSNASSARPLRIPAGAVVTLPAQGVSPPAIGMRDLPVDQNACQNAQFPLAFSGEAHG